MHLELDKLINNLLSKGELSERSIELLIKKAEQLGVDTIDFELELEGLIAEAKTKTTAVPPTPPANNKEGTIKKCPSCGAVAESFNTKCSDCGHEFRNTAASCTGKTINDELIKIEDVVRKDYFDNNRDRNVFPASGLMRKETVMMKHQSQINQELEAAYVDRKSSFIMSFPIPNTKEDILEILAIGVPEAKKKMGFWDNVQQSKGKMKKTWLAKCEQVIIKARLSMKDDKKTLEEIEEYAKQLGI
jgi:hypothetical protein